MLYENWRDVPWDAARWPNFAPGEKNLPCPCCGEFFMDEASFDALQAARSIVGRPFTVNSGHRCPIHNARVGGAPLSMHKQIAFDISLGGHDRHALLEACRAAGFRGFGFYGTFLHVDMGRARTWFGSKAGERLWKA